MAEPIPHQILIECPEQISDRRLRKVVAELMDVMADRGIRAVITTRSDVPSGWEFNTQDLFVSQS